jgi:hypothetical protein
MLVIFLSLVLLLQNMGNSGKFLDITEIMICIGFAIMLMQKSYFVVYQNRTILTQMIDDLDAVIPKVRRVQNGFGIGDYYERMRLVSIV